MRNTPYGQPNNHIPSLSSLSSIDQPRNYNSNSRPILSPLQSETYQSQKSLTKTSSSLGIVDQFRQHGSSCNCGMAVEVISLRAQNNQLRVQVSKAGRFHSSPEDHNYRAKYQIYQEYLQNSQTNNDSLRRQNSELRRQNQMMEGLQRKVRQLEQDKSLLEESLRAQMEENLRMNQQGARDFQNSPNGVYVLQLERNNSSLINENKRLSGIIMDRIKKTFV